MPYNKKWDKYWVSLHHADPTEGQHWSEISYPFYHRKAFVELPIRWPQCWKNGRRPIIITHFAVGTDYKGSGRVVFSGPIISPVKLTGGTSFFLAQIEGYDNVE